MTYFYCFVCGDEIDTKETCDTVTLPNGYIAHKECEHSYYQEVEDVHTNRFADSLLSLDIDSGACVSNGFDFNLFRTGV